LQRAITSAAHGVHQKRQREQQAKQPVRGRGNATKRIVVGVIQRIAADDQHAAQGNQKHAAAAALAVTPPRRDVRVPKPAAEPQRHERARAMNRDQPALGRIRHVPERPALLQEIVEHQP